MSTATVSKGPEHYYDLVRAAMGSDPTAARHINLHIRAKSGHNSIVSFHQNGSSDEDKMKTYVECLVAFRTRDWSRLAPVNEPPAEVTGGDESEPEEGEGNEAALAVVREDPDGGVPGDESEPDGHDDDEAIAPAVELQGDESMDDNEPDIQQALRILGKAMAKPRKVELNENRVLEILKDQAPALLKSDILNWLKVPMAEIDAKLTEAMGQFNRSELESVVISALQSVVGKKVSDGLQNGDLELLPPVQPVDPRYVRNRVSERVARAIDKKHNVIVSGPSGSGKTFIIEQELRRNQMRYIGPISVAAGITKKDMLAREWLQAGPNGVVTKWIYGFVVKAMIHGVPLILDEISLLEGEVLGHLYYACEYGVLHLQETGETITAKPGGKFMIFGTDNSLTDESGLYSGHRMSIALTNRFRYVFSDYMDADSEMEIFEKSGVGYTIASRIRLFLEKCRKMYADGSLCFAPSTRVGKNIAEEIAAGLNFEEAVAYCLTDSLVPSEQKKVLALI